MTRRFGRQWDTRSSTQRLQDAASASAHDALRAARAVTIDRRALWPDVRWGVGQAAHVVGALCAWATFIYLVRGARAFTVHHRTYGEMLFIYAAGGVVSGAVVGILRPLLHSEVGAYLVGLSAAALAVPFATNGYATPVWHWDRDTWFANGLFALIAGVFLGRELWKAHDPQGRRSRRAEPAT